MKTLKNFSIFVANDPLSLDKLDLVANVNIDLPEEDANISKFLSSMGDIERIIISEYSKQPEIVNYASQTSKYIGNYDVIKVNLFGSNDSEQLKLQRYCNYLRERKKAAILKFGNLIFHLLPSIDCILLVKNPTLNSNSKTQISRESTSSTTQDNSFLGSLLNKMGNIQDCRQHKIQNIDQSKQQRMEEVQNLTNRLRNLFQSFSDDSDFKEYHLEPMDKESRYVCHEVKEEFNDLVTVAIGEDSERLDFYL